MPDNRRLGPAEQLRRSIAIAGIGFGFPLGVYPLLMISGWLVRGDSFDAGLLQLTLEFIVPAAAQAASLVFAIEVLRTRDPVRTRRLSRWQAALFGLGVGLYLAAFALYV